MIKFKAILQRITRPKVTTLPGFIQFAHLEKGIRILNKVLSGLQMCYNHDSTCQTEMK